MEKYIKAVRLFESSFEARRNFCTNCPFREQCDTLSFKKCVEVQAYCLKDFLENYEKSLENA